MLTYAEVQLPVEVNGGMTEKNVRKLHSRNLNLKVRLKSDDRLNLVDFIF